MAEAFREPVGRRTINFDEGMVITRRGYTTAIKKNTVTYYGSTEGG